MRPMLTNHPDIYYAATAHSAPERPVLQGCVETDVCVVGGGFTGISSGLFLAEAGYRVCVLEAVKIGFGASGRNGGQIVNSYSRDLDVIERCASPKATQLIGEMAFEGSRIIRERITRYAISCDLQNGGIFAALNQNHMRHLEQQHKRWARYGYHELTPLDKADIRHLVDSPRYVGGLLDKTGGHIHPINLLLGEAAALERLGGRIYEHSPAIRIESQESTSPILHTSQGCVKTKFIIVAGNAYLGDFLPKLQRKSMPCGSQVIATAPLTPEAAQKLLPKNHCVEDCNYLLDYYRRSADNRLIYGGGVSYGAKAPKDIQRSLRQKLEQTFPQLKGIAIDYAWTGNFLLTLSRLPQMGRLNRHVYFSQGCSGHGVTYTHLAGKILAELIQGQSERFDAFASLPHYPFPGGRYFQAPLSALGAFYYNLRDRLGV